MKQKRKVSKNASKIPKRRSVVYISAQFECRLQYLFVLCNVNRIEWKIFRNKITAQDTLRSFADPPGTVKLPSKWQIHIHACDMYMNIWWVRCLSNECSTVCKEPCCEPWQAKNIWLVLTNIQDEENLWNILNYVYLNDFGALLSKHGTNNKIHFKYNYKENFLRTQEKMETSYVCLGLSFTVLLGRKCFNV